MDKNLASQLLTQMAEIQSSVGGPSTGWFTVGAAVIGFLTAMLSTVLVEHLKRRHEKKTLLASLMAEISAIAGIIRARGLMETLEEGARSQRNNLRIKVPKDYFIVYKSNTARLGLLSPDYAGQIVCFYHLIESVVQDITPGGVLYEDGAVQELFQQDVEFIKRALELADGLIAKPDTQPCASCRPPR